MDDRLLTVKKLVAWIAAPVVFCLSVHCAMAQVMTVQPVSAILQMVKTAGYIAVRKIQLSNDEYWVHALDNEGEPVDLRINAHNGQIINMQKTDWHISMQEVIEKVEAVGYAGILFIQAKNNYYELIAIDPNGKKTNLKVDAINGNFLEKSDPV